MKYAPNAEVYDAREMGPIGPECFGGEDFPSEDPVPPTRYPGRLSAELQNDREREIARVAFEEGADAMEAATLEAFKEGIVGVAMEAEVIDSEAFELFVTKLRAKLEQGAREYGDASFEKPFGRLLGEIEEEIIDQAGWAWIMFVKLQKRRARLERLDEILEELG